MNLKACLHHFLGAVATSLALAVEMAQKVLSQVQQPQSISAHTILHRLLPAVKICNILFTEIISINNQMMHVTSIVEHNKILLC